MGILLYWYGVEWWVADVFLYRGWSLFGGRGVSENTGEVFALWLGLDGCVAAPYGKRFWCSLSFPQLRSRFFNLSSSRSQGFQLQFPQNLSFLI